MEQQHLYIGIRRAGVWRVRPVADLAEHELDGVNILRDVQCVSTLGADPEGAIRQVVRQAHRSVAPFFALTHARQGLRILQACVARISSAVPPLHAPSEHASPESRDDAGSLQGSAEERDRTDEQLRLERLQADLWGGREGGDVDDTADALLWEARERAEAARLGVEERFSTVTRRLVEAWRTRAHAGRAERMVRAAEDRTDTDESLIRERAHCDEVLARRDEILAAAGHELRNMVAGSIGFADIIEGEARLLGYETLLKPAQNILRAGARMQRLIGDLVDAARIAARGLEIKREPSDLTTLVTEALDAFEVNARARDISLTVSIAKPLPLLSIDPARVLQVLVNLLSNALKFTPTGGNVVVGIEQVGDEVRCAVADTGPGVPAHMLDAIFERYSQVLNSDRRGLGLGLYIAKYIVQQHGGRLWAQSELGSGTTMFLTLPATSSTSCSEERAPI